MVDAKVKKSMADHIRTHVKYPTTKADLVKACNNMSEFSMEHKQWFEKTLPSGTYKSANDVIKSLGI